MTMEPFNLTTDERRAGWLAPALDNLFPAAIGGEETVATMFDLRKLRFRKLTITPEWEQMIYSYDVLVILPRVSPASPL